MKRRISAADIVVFIVLFLSLAAAIAAAYTFLMKEADYRASEKGYEEIRSEYVRPGNRDESRSRGITETEEEPEEPLPIEPPAVDWEGLKAENSDIIGWIQVPASGIEYPVLQGDSNDEYLHTSVSGEWRTAGSIFLDSQNSPDMTDLHSIIYGHNMRNGSMFANLKEFNTPGILEACPYFWVSTPKKDLLYQIVSIHTAVTGGESFTLFPETARNPAFNGWMEKEINKSNIECKLPDRYIKRMVTLSTCTPYSDGTRQLVQGILVREAARQ